MVKYTTIATILIATTHIAEVFGDGKPRRLRYDAANERGLQVTSKASKNAKVSRNSLIYIFFNYVYVLTQYHCAQAEIGKVNFCHYDDDINATCTYENIEVSANSALAHEAHGDTRGTCEEYCSLTNATYDPNTCMCVIEDASISISMRMLVFDVKGEWDE